MHEFRSLLNFHHLMILCDLFETESCDKDICDQWARSRHEEVFYTTY